MLVLGKPVITRRMGGGDHGLKGSALSGILVTSGLRELMPYFKLSGNEARGIDYTPAKLQTRG